MLPSGESQKHEFQAETRQLLDIVARTLYSEKEVLVLTMMNKATHQYIYFKNYVVINVWEKIRMHVTFNYH